MWQISSYLPNIAHSKFKLMLNALIFIDENTTFTYFIKPELEGVLENNHTCMKC